jgi:demethylmenaquinone methyltransferase/2-methoxy-6-polyprenyl-1,4-benzoquinol methylase
MPDGLNVMEIPTGFVEKSRFVRVIFTDVEREYDVLLHLLTFGMDWAWRRRMLARITHRESIRVLDLACGTGLVTFPLQRLVGPGGLVVGLDPSIAMLQPAVRRKRLKVVPVELVRAVGESMPFRDGVFEYETIGLALRNFGDKEAMFKEAHRTLANAGWFLSVDFVLPNKPLIRKLYLFYVLKVFPALGRLVSESWLRTLVYLGKSIQLSTPPQAVCKMLSGEGFRQTFFQRITLGVVAIVGGQKQSTSTHRGKSLAWKPTGRLIAMS